MNDTGRSFSSSMVSICDWASTHSQPARNAGAGLEELGQNRLEARKLNLAPQTKLGTKSRVGAAQAS
jgi:hypothetical protein